MNGRDHILFKQEYWAKSNDIRLMGELGDQKYRLYTQQLEDNLFLPLSDEVKANFVAADGNELFGDPCKMQALHSSSAIAVNIFQYWQDLSRAFCAAQACGFCRKDNRTSEKIVFEEKFPIDRSFPTAPNIDVVIHNADKNQYKVYAIECKFSEPYSKRTTQGGLRPSYLNRPKLCEGIPALISFASSISPIDELNHYLNAAQLVKHILGLKQKYGKRGFRLLYLWYNVPGKDGYFHQREIDSFKKICDCDGIKFHAMTYQHLIQSLAKYYEKEHSPYVQYIVGRYF